MAKPLIIRPAGPEDAEPVAQRVGELLTEIMAAIQSPAFNFDLAATVTRLRQFLEQGHYFVQLAEDQAGQVVGFVALYQSHALYAEGAFGTIAELYVCPPYRAQGLGRQLIAAAKALATAQAWTRLEVTTPPLPTFDRTLAFYQREGFAISGGRKLKISM